MDLNSYAELAVRLVNTAGAGGEDGDRLANLEGLRVLVADREHLNTGVTRNDLDSLRDLRGNSALSSSPAPKGTAMTPLPG